MTPILSFLKDNYALTDPILKRQLEKRAARYTILNDTLYKKSFTLPLLRCLTHSEATYVLKEIHEGICDNHLGGRALALKVLQQGFFWPTMWKDATTFVKKFNKCQSFTPIPQQPAEALKQIFSLWPFCVWVIDILGPFPMATAQRKFLLVACDYFIKWIEAEPIATIIARNMENFI